MSLPIEEAAALNAARQFLLDLSSGAERRIPTATRERARQVLRHYPLLAGERWLEHRDEETIGHAPGIVYKPSSREFQ